MQVTATTKDRNDRDLEVEFLLVEGTAAFFSRSFGNWLPGEPAHLEFLAARVLDGARWKPLSREQLEKICDYDSVCDEAHIEFKDHDPNILDDRDEEF